MKKKEFCLEEYSEIVYITTSYIFIAIIMHALTRF